MKKAYIKQDENGRYRFGIPSALNKKKITWSVNSWKDKKTAINKIKCSDMQIIDLTKRR